MKEPIRVLLVDDEQDLTQALSKRLTRKGLIVQAAADGDEAFDALSRDRFDVVVLDINMPNVDGMQTLKAIRISFPEVAVILHTGAGTITEARKAIQLGAFDFLFKPMPFDGLVVKIRDAAESVGGQRDRVNDPVPVRRSPRVRAGT